MAAAVLNPSSSAPCERILQWYAVLLSAHRRSPYVWPRWAAPARPLSGQLCGSQRAPCAAYAAPTSPCLPPLLSLMIRISISVHCTPDAGGRAPARRASMSFVPLPPCTLTPSPSSRLITCLIASPWPPAAGALPRAAHPSSLCVFPGPGPTSCAPHIRPEPPAPQPSDYSPARSRFFACAVKLQRTTAFARRPGSPVFHHQTSRARRRPNAPVSTLISVGYM